MPRKSLYRRRRRVIRRKVNRLKRKISKAGLSPMKQHATIVESFELTDLKSDKPYQQIFSLSQFYRATTIAKNFQFYRAVKVKWEYAPLYNTFQQSNSTAVVAKPQFYFIMNRDQNPYWSAQNAATSKFAMISTGADPVAFVKNKEIIYKPNWCSPGVQALRFSPAVSPDGGAFQAVTNVIALGLKKQFGWLPTSDLDGYDAPDLYNPIEGPIKVNGTQPLNIQPTANSGVVYNGHNVYIEQDNEPNVPVCKVLCTVEWQFKGPKNNYVQLESAATQTAK